tara:strand:- start:309 stop:1316 length:1008 start_codon:yes stop_codon:yes gene_type:complete
MVDFVKTLNILDTIDKNFRVELEIIEREILSSIPNSSPSLLHHASEHLINNGGKRIRPTLLMLSQKTLSSKVDLNQILPVAVAIELIHTSTIIHDDIIDCSSLRRGGQTVNARWGDDVALIAGDLIFSKAFGLISSYEDKRISDSIYDACKKLADGQILETIHTGDTNMTEEVYLEIIERKTASLFEASTRCGAILGGGNKKEVESLSRYGFLIGTGFQMTDDALDISAGEFQLGKPVGVDVTLGKPTFLILHALRKASVKDKKFLERVLNKVDVTLDDINIARNIIKRTNSLEYAFNRSESFITQAKVEIKHCKESKAKEALLRIADYAINRGS